MSYPVSTAFINALGTSHTVTTAAFLFDPLSGNQLLPGMVLIGGSVSVDRTAQYRRTCQVQLLPDVNSLPGSAADALAPYGNRVRLYRGMIIPGPAPQVNTLVPLGVFRLASTGSSETDDGQLALNFSGFDNSRQVSRAKFTTPYLIAAGTDYVAAIVALITNRMPDVIIDVPTSTGELTPQIVCDVGADPWDQLTQMAGALGMECFFTVDGTFRLQSVPDASSTPVAYSFVEGNGTTVTDIDREFDDDPGFNGVIMQAESSSLPVPLTSIAWDSDPSSPTYYLGGYGQVPDTQTNAYIGSQAQADSAAAAYVLANHGGTEGISISAIPNPALSESDVIQVVRSRLKLNQTAVIESMVIPLDVGSKMTITGAKRVAA